MNKASVRAVEVETYSLKDLHRGLGIKDSDRLSALTLAVSLNGDRSKVKYAGQLAAKDVRDIEGWSTPTLNNYAGLIPSKPAAKRGTSADMVIVHALWLDLDVKEGSFESLEQAREFIEDLSEDLGQRPLAIVATGGGLQPIWKLRGKGRRDRPRMEALSRAFHAYAQKAVRSLLGIKIDSINDMARVLRLVGSRNAKYPERPLVTITAGGGDALRVEDLETLLEPVTVAKVKPRDGDGGGTGGVVYGLVSEGVLEVEAVLPDGWECEDGFDGKTYFMRPGATSGQSGNVLDAVFTFHSGGIAWTDPVSGLTPMAVIARHSFKDEYGDACQALEHAAAEMVDDGVMPVDGPFKRFSADALTRVNDARLAERAKFKSGQDQAPGNDPRFQKMGEDEFWESRETLKWVRDKARFRQIGPYANLGATLARFAADLPPNLVLPPIIGGDASMYIGIMFVGNSGLGKSASFGPTREVRKWLGGTHEVASGEAVVDLYGVEVRKRTTRVSEHAVILFDEIDTLKATADRSGSTVMPKLRSVLGPSATLGFAARGVGRSAVVPAYTHAGAVVVNTQVERCAWILDDWAGGTPQRFIYMPTNDPHLDEDPDVVYPNPGDAPFNYSLLCDGGCVKVVEASAKAFAESANASGSAARKVAGAELNEAVLKVETHFAEKKHDEISLCAEAGTEVRADRRKRLRDDIGKTVAGDLNGHLLLTAERVAGLLAVMEGRTVMSSQDWKLAGHIIATSLGMVEVMRSSLSHANARDSKQRAVAQGTYAAISDDVKHGKAIERVAARLPKIVAKQGELSRGKFRNKLNSRDRDHFDEALELAISGGSLFTRRHGKTEMISTSPTQSDGGTS